MNRSFKLLINGQLVAGATAAPVINPATGEPFADRPVASLDQLNEAVAAAKAAQPGWAAMPYGDRRIVLERMADRIEEGSDELARVLTLEQGKPLRDSRAEIGLFVATIREFCKMDLGAEIIEDTTTNRVEAYYRPFGVVAAIIPWNFPIGLIGNKLPPALLAGNTMVIKPASSTPLSAVLLGAMIGDIVPPGVVNVLCDNGGLGGPLTQTGLNSRVLGQKSCSLASSRVARTPPRHRRCPQEPRRVRAAPRPPRLTVARVPQNVSQLGAETRYALRTARRTRATGAQQVRHDRVVIGDGIGSDGSFFLRRLLLLVPLVQNLFFEFLLVVHRLSSTCFR